MCGTIKYEMTARKIGKLIPATPNQPVSVMRQDGSLVMSRWLGHIRSEKGPPPLPHESVKILASEYTEKGVPFAVPHNKAIDAYLIKCSTYPGGSGVFIITRDATQAELRKCSHPRHPRLVDR